MPALDFIHDFRLSDAPDYAVERCFLSLLDLLGIAAAATQTRLSAIIRDHSAEEFGGPLPIMFDNRRSSAQGVALAAGMTIDSLDGHDGFNPAKGHIGCPLFPAIFAMALENDLTGTEFLEALLMGYEFGARASVAQHATVPDYHTSGSWGAVTAASACARLMRLSPEETRHALGIAEYHGPRSQMMRCIDHPTMLKDGSGWGAMTGVAAAKLARKGFTGAPAITIEEADSYWADLGERWYMSEQYYKPYPVCRWAQAPIEGARSLMQQHGFSAHEVQKIEVDTFHEAVRLATNSPRTTEEAQYSTSFPVAVALARGDVRAADVSDDGLNDPEILRLSHCLTMRENDAANRNFPARRLAKVTITLNDDQVFFGEWMEPRWDATHPPSAQELMDKYHSLADPALGTTRAQSILEAVNALTETKASVLLDLLTGAIE